MLMKLKLKYVLKYQYGSKCFLCISKMKIPLNIYTNKNNDLWQYSDIQW